MRARTDPLPLPSPGVRFGPDLFERLGRLVAQVASARERREGAGRHGWLGSGSEFVGYRRYRPGEDLRLFDWNLFARSGQPYVRVTRREASVSWAVLLDTSASMGLGARGKLQCAAEVAAALSALGRREGAVVQLHLSGTGGVYRATKNRPLSEPLAFLEGARAAGDRGLATLVAEPGRFREAGAVYLLGDLLDLEPADVLALARRGRELACARILAPEELAPPSDVRVRWVDPESGLACTQFLDGETHDRYGILLEELLKAWDRRAARHRVAHHTWQSSAPMESVVAGLFGG